jgi:Peptidase M15
VPRNRRGGLFKFLLDLWLVGTLLVPQGPTFGKFDPKRAKISVKFKGEVYPFEVTTVFVLPKEKLVMEMLSEGHADYVVEVPRGSVTPNGSNTWTWRAPSQKGRYRIKISSPALKQPATLNVFVMIPYAKLKRGYLNGYRIGAYPSRLLRNNLIYRHPEGFIEVTKENQDTLVSPHFKLRQFLCKQEGDFPKYLVLNELLLLKLETLLEKVNEMGYPCDTFHVMSGYRTPYYNKALGNVKYSLHQWGRAADIFIDKDKDGLMDDLNEDRKVDYQDAAVLQNTVDNMQAERQYHAFLGGLGVYDSTASHGPFVHVDVRGVQAKWGESVDRKAASKR